MRRHDKRRKPRKAHVRHILVAAKPDARSILEQIQSAKRPLKVFKKLAKTLKFVAQGKQRLTYDY